MNEAHHDTTMLIEVRFRDYRITPREINPVDVWDAVAVALDRKFDSYSSTNVFTVAVQAGDPVKGAEDE